jgi:hypothetical protein
LKQSLTTSLRRIGKPNKRKFGVNTGNNEQRYVNKELQGFNVHGDNYRVMKMFVER